VRRQTRCAGTSSAWPGLVSSIFTMERSEQSCPGRSALATPSRTLARLQQDKSLWGPRVSLLGTPGCGPRRGQGALGGLSARQARTHGHGAGDTCWVTGGTSGPALSRTWPVHQRRPGQQVPAPRPTGTGPSLSPGVTAPEPAPPSGRKGTRGGATRLPGSWLPGHPGDPAGHLRSHHRRRDLRCLWALVPSS
jgi:hypothetical protein